MRGQFASPDGALAALHIELLSHQQVIPGDRLLYIADLIREGRRMCAEQANPSADPSHALLLQLAAAVAMNLRALGLLARADTLLRGASAAPNMGGELVTGWRGDFERWLQSIEAQP